MGWAGGGGGVRAKIGCASRLLLLLPPSYLQRAPQAVELDRLVHLQHGVRARLLVAAPHVQQPQLAQHRLRLLQRRLEDGARAEDAHLRQQARRRRHARVRPRRAVGRAVPHGARGQGMHARGQGGVVRRELHGAARGGVHAAHERCGEVRLQRVLRADGGVNHAEQRKGVAQLAEGLGAASIHRARAEHRRQSARRSE